MPWRTNKCNVVTHYSQTLDPGHSRSQVHHCRVVFAHSHLTDEIDMLSSRRTLSDKVKDIRSRSRVAAGRYIQPNADAHKGRTPSCLADTPDGCNEYFPIYAIIKRAEIDDWCV